jgi:F0F1-type ATP synthase membrane subunit c/vacuolar-type H+-ATPase subunit K
MLIVKAFKSIGLGLVLIPLTGCAIGLGTLFAALIRGVSYTPDMEDSLFGYTILGLAFIEFFALVAVALAAAIYAL